MRRLSRNVGALVAACLLAVSGASFAASVPLTDEALAPLTAAYMRAVKPGQQAELHRELYQTVLQRIERTYARDVDMPALVAAALKTLEPLPAQSGEPGAVFKKSINAALAELDPHSRYLDPKAQAEERSSIAGSFGGLGLQVDMVEGLMRIISPMPDTPAARAGLQSGDVIVRLDDQPVMGMALTDAISRMRGEPGTPIALMVRRVGMGDDFNVSLVREAISTPPLRWSMEGDVLVLRLSGFTGAAPALEKAVAEAVAVRQPRGIVLDVRGNPGGLFRQAVLLADAFLSEGEIVSLRGRTPGNQRSWRAEPGELLAGLPMVILIDGRSASASELLAAALQENGRATVMGQRSYGKGSVQTIVALGIDKGALRLTTALYHGPSGRSVQRTGVGPDIELVATAGASGTRKGEGDRAHALPGSDEPLPPKASVEQSHCAPLKKANSDPALSCALAFLDAGGVDAFVSALGTAETAASH